MKKKLFMTLSGITTVVAPLATIISCGQNKELSLKINIEPNSSIHINAEINAKWEDLYNRYNFEFDKMIQLIPSTSVVDFVTPENNINKLQNDIFPIIDQINKEYKALNEKIQSDPLYKKYFDPTSYYYHQTQESYKNINDSRKNFISNNVLAIQSSYAQRLATLFDLNNDVVVDPKSNSQIKSGFFAWNSTIT